jgi:hypothetical protein
MSENAFTTPAKPTSADYEGIAKADPKIVSGARWFWWIAGLSLVNTVLIHSGSQTSFVIGLGFTLLADAIFQTVKPIAFALDAMALAVFFGLGWFALRGRTWAFVIGIVLYAGDAIIYLLGQDWMSVAFHALALFYLIRATLSLREAIKAAAAEPPVSAPAAGA